MRLRFARVVFLGVLMIYLFYYLPSSWLYTPVTVERVTRFLIPGSPLLGSYLVDYLVLIIFNVLFAISSRSMKALSTTMVLPVSYALLKIFGDSRYLLLIPLQIICSAALSRVRLRDALIAIIMGLLSLSLVSIASSMYYFIYKSDLSYLRQYIEPLRITWSFPGAVAIITLIPMGILSLFTRYINIARNMEDISDRGAPILLIASLMIPPIFIVLTHLPSVNPGLYPVSVDTYFYTKFLQEAGSHGLHNALEKNYPERPLYLLMIYYLNMAIREPVILLDIVHPIIAIDLLVITSYIVSKKLYGPKYSGWIALFTASGHATYGFIAGGFQANSLALPFALLLMISRPGIYSLILLILIAMIHPWTFAMYACSWILFHIIARNWKGAIMGLIMVITIVGVGEALTRNLSGGSIASPIINTIMYGINKLINIVRIGNPLENIYLGYTLYAWSSIYVPPIALMTIYSIYRGLPRELASIALVSSVAAIATQSDLSLIYRVYLNTPLEIMIKPALEDSEKISRYARLAIFIITIAYGLTILIGLTPLKGDPWERITRIR